MNPRNFIEILAIYHNDKYNIFYIKNQHQKIKLF